MIRLGVNIDHVATVRNARGEQYPNPVQAAHLCELAGADNITCHLREDRRHIRDKDVFLLKDTIGIPLNLEMAATSEMLDIALSVRPFAVTLVPEKREELTTEGGLAVFKLQEKLGPFIDRMKAKDILVSLFVDPNEQDIRIAKALNADAVEIHTGDLCHHLLKIRRSGKSLELLKPFQEAAQTSHDLGLQVHVGHGLNYNNANIIQKIPHCEEANIGHAIIARAISTGLVEAVKEMKRLLNDKDYK